MCVFQLGAERTAAGGKHCGGKQGIRFSCKPMERPESFSRLTVLYLNHCISARRAVPKSGITHISFLRWINEENEKPTVSIQIFLAIGITLTYNKIGMVIIEKLYNVNSKL